MASVPNELLLNVFSHLATGDPTDVRTLLNLCRTSRLLLDLAQPILYTNVRIAEPAGDPLRLLKSFLRTILEHPSLAKETQELALVNELGIRYEWPVLAHDTCFMEISALIGGHPSEIEPDLCYEPLAIEVLVRLPNLQHLHLNAQIEHPRALLERLHQLRTESLLFAKLKSFHLHKQYENGPVNIEDYIPFLLYPSFERLSTETDVPGHIGNRAINTVTHSSVNLLWCIGPPSTLRKLLETCRDLNVFEFLIPDRFSSRVEITISDVWAQPLVAPRNLVETLIQLHGPTLTSISLDYHHSYDLHDPELREELERWGQPLDDNDFTYPSFRDCENLTRLSIEFEKLVKIRNLPTSLKWLNLSYCHFEDMGKEYLSDFINVREKWCPRIESIIVSGLEKGKDGITLVLEHARSLDAPVQVSIDGRTLTFSGAASHLRIQSCEPQFANVLDREDMEPEEQFL